MKLQLEGSQWTTFLELISASSSSVLLIKENALCGRYSSGFSFLHRKYSAGGTNEHIAIAAQYRYIYLGLVCGTLFVHHSVWQHRQVLQRGP